MAFAMAREAEVLPAAVRPAGRPRHLPRGTILFQQGDKAEAFYRIERGEVRVSKMDDQGRQLEVARLGPGEFLGEAIAFLGGRFPFLAEAAADAEVSVFQAREVLAAAGRDPAAARFFIELLARKCLVLSGRVESFGLETVRQRLARYLLGRCGGERGCVIRLPVKKSELAAQLGTIPETLSRGLKRFQEGGLIEVRGAEIRVVDCPGLRAELGEI